MTSTNNNKRRPDGTQPGDDRLMMLSPELWGHWPVLPLKRRPMEVGKPPDTAVLYDMTHEGIEARHLARRFRFLDNCMIFLVTLEEVRAAPITDIDKILEDGWVVD